MIEPKTIALIVQVSVTLPSDVVDQLGPDLADQIHIQDPWVTIRAADQAGPGRYEPIWNGRAAVRFVGSLGP